MWLPASERYSVGFYHTLGSLLSKGVRTVEGLIFVCHLSHPQNKNQCWEPLNSISLHGCKTAGITMSAVSCFEIVTPFVLHLTNGGPGKLSFAQKSHSLFQKAPWSSSLSGSTKKGWHESVSSCPCLPIIPCQSGSGQRLCERNMWVVLWIFLSSFTSKQWLAWGQDASTEVEIDLTLFCKEHSLLRRTKFQPPRWVHQLVKPLVECQGFFFFSFSS